ncbi:P-loop NTPase fold protein [Plectonema radiosum NIES-515]|uniref:P-loop NTPase fold protein n=1 Tax=Plectonema radiosum NIES-515 TaxID=2986073 RepID=A0ABT3B2A4_9CYAN|nr:P-loop NTPase fold protein [Plectonema radiosum]MCV3215488.1 P-loop NTPase fold protein [Plectonema radiosum NIES-515]
MENPSVSPIEDINAAIQSHNPFSNAGIVKEQDIWGKGFPDVPTLNAHASDTVFQAIELVRNSQSSQDKVTSIAITAQYGVGKTHLLSRIRHRLEREGGALFVYAGVNNYTDLNLVKYQFQQTLADSLSKTGSQGVMQWQEVAAAIANEGFKAINPNAPNLSPQDLVDRFDKVSASWSAKNKSLMNTLTKQILKTKSNVDPYILRAILWTLSETQASFAREWLSGHELANSNADTLGLPNPSKTSQDREAEALKNIQQILNLVSYYNPVVICFDEIDVKNNSTDDGLPTEFVIANLVKILHDTLENSELGRGVVILTVMMPDTWANKVNIIPGGTPDRISKYTQRKPIDLKPLSGDSMLELVSMWLKEFYETRSLTPPNTLYPFEESELIKYGKNQLTVREALQWCAENFKVDAEELPKEPFERFELALNRESEVDLGDYLEEKHNSLIAEALRFGFQTLKGQTLEGETETGETLNEVTVEDVTEVEPKSKNQGWINFKIIGKDKNKAFKIGVTVLQYSNGRVVGAGMWRLIDYETFDITRGCLVRSKEKTIRKNWESYGHLNKLVQDLGGEWVYLKAEEIQPLIHLYSVYQKRELYQLNEEQVIEFSKPITAENPLLREILSDPSGEIDEETIEGDELLNDFLNPPTIEDTDDADDLGDLFN